MYKLMTLGTLLVGLALTPFLSGEVAQPEQPVVNSHVQTVQSELDEPETSRGCEWSCEACGPDQSCSQICTEVGECGSTCSFVMECKAGLRWDEMECGCV